MRINQFVALATGLSRRAADDAIASGRVTIADRAAQVGEPAPADADIRLDGHPLSLPQAFTYLALHKPAGYVSSRKRQGTDPTIYNLLPADYQSLRLAGRLDRDSSGLLILSDDGNFLNRLSHPSMGKTKTYELNLSRPLTPKDRASLESGISLSDGPSVIKVKQLSGVHAVVTLEEGRNRQIRRTLGAIGYTVEKLHRTHIGSYALADLPPGEWLVITPETTP